MDSSQPSPRRSAELAAAAHTPGPSGRQREPQGYRNIDFPNLGECRASYPYPADQASARPLTWLDDDQIEQRIIRAYVHLALDSTERNGSRVVTIARAGVLEARLSEVPAPGRELGLPHFWLEIYSHATRSWSRTP
jgi:hypothetical protein